MSTKPKLQDTLEVFLEEMDSLKTSLEKFDKLNPELSRIVEDFKETELKVNTFYFEGLMDNFIKQMKIERQDYEAVLEQHLENQQKQFNKESDFNKLRYYFQMALLIIAVGTASLLSISYVNNKDLKKEKSAILEINSNLKEYIEATDQVKHFLKWKEEHE